MARGCTPQEETYFETDGQSTRLYLAALNPATVFSARVNGTPSSDDQVGELTFDGGSGAGGLANQLVYVGTSAGKYDKGMVRLRANVSGASGTVKIGEISEIEWADDDHLTVVDELALAPRHLRILSDKTVLMDYDIAYTNQHAYPNPMPLLGPSLVPVWLAGASVRVQWDAGDSWALDGGAITVAWAFPGSTANGGLAGDTTWADYDTAGTYQVTCTVTRDYGGGIVKTHTGHRYVLVFDANNPPLLDFSLDQCGGAWDQRGYTFRVTLNDADEASISNIRDRAWVVLFARDRYGDDEVSIGPIPDRENILVEGWIASETITVDPEQGLVSFEIRHPMWWVSKMRGFPSGLEDVQATPTAWTQFEDLTLRDGLWHFLYWRTTLPSLLDVHLTDDATGIAMFNASPGTLGQQIIGEANNTIRAFPCCDRFGRLYIEREPQLIPEGDRSGIPIVQDLELQDLLRPFTLERRVVNSAAVVDMTGMAYSDGDYAPYFSLAPGHIPNWHGDQVDRGDRLALVNQAQANELAGLMLGWKNIEYPNVTLPLASNQRMFDLCPHQYATLDLAAGDTLRGVALSLTLIVRAVTFKYNPVTGQLLTTLRTEQASVAETSMDGDIPPEPPDLPPPDVPDPAPWDPLPDLTPDITWPSIGFIAGHVKGVYKGVGDFDPLTATQPTWAAINGGLPTTDVSHFGINAGDTGEKQQVLRLVTDTQIYIRDEDVSSNWSVALTTTKVQGDLSASAVILMMGVDPTTGRIWVFCYDNTNPGSNGKSYVYYSDNWGTSWTGPNAQDHATEWDDNIRLEGDGGQISGMGSVCWVSAWSYSYRTALWYGPNNGASGWEISNLMWYTGYDPPLFVHPGGDGLTAYSSADGKYIAQWNGNNTGLTELETDGLWDHNPDPYDERWGSMWGSWTNANVMRCYTRFGGYQRIAETANNWTSYDFGADFDATLGSAWATHLAPVVNPDDEDMIAFGVARLGIAPSATYAAVYSMYSIDGTPVAKAGSMPDSSPFTDSIPYDLGRIAKGGLQFVAGS